MEADEVSVERAAGRAGRRAEEGAPVAADGSYEFSGVEIAENRVFMVTVSVQEVDYNSDPLHSSDIIAGQAADLPRHQPGRLIGLLDRPLLNDRIAEARRVRYEMAHGDRL